MHAITRQLMRVRRLGRTLLVVQRLAQAGAVALGALLTLGVIDFILRLPATLRGALMAALVLMIGAWLGTRLVRAARFAPSLTDLALRAERLFPQFAGSLASAVEFTEHAPAYTDPARTAALADTSRARVDGGLEAGQLGRLLAPKRTLVCVGAAVGLAVLATITVAAAPEAGRIAAARWLTPWTGVEWPKRTAVASLTNEQAWPADTPLPMRAAVERGHRQGMRVWVHYRLLDAHGESTAWRRVLMSEQTPTPAPVPGSGPGSGTAPVNGADRAGDQRQALAVPVAQQTPPAPRFERLVELADRVPAADAQGTHGRVEYYFEAGDDRTDAQTLELIERPTVTAVQALIEPPTYALGLIEAQRTDLHALRDPRPTVRGLVGSTATLHIRFNKPLPITAADVPALVPGLTAQLDASAPSDAQSPLRVETDAAGSDASDQPVQQITLRFPLRDRIETPIDLVDAHGFTNLSERRYIIEAQTDEPPTASLLRPERDESVLPEAEVAIEALAQDDIGVESVAIAAEVPVAAAEGAHDHVAASGSEETTVTLTLAEQTGRQPRLSVTHTFDLSELALSAGDVVTLTAVTRDVYELDGERYDPVRSAPRRLRIIDATTLTRQIRSELAGVRQQAGRLDARQRQLAERDPDAARREQARLTRQIEAQGGLVQRLMDRAERNRLDEPALDELMTQAREFLDKAGEASDAAAAGLDAATEAEDPDAAAAQEQQARAQQQDVRAALNDLVALLDQGQDAMALQLELRRLRTDQRNIEAETGELLPQTAGSRLEDLPEELREQLEALAERQQATAEQAQELIEQMRATAEALSQAEDERSAAVAEALAEAAALAEREALAERMDESFEAIDQNRLSQAGESQAQSLDTMERMLEQMGEHERRMQAMLRRRLQELAERLEALLERQKERLAGLEAQLDPADQADQADRDDGDGAAGAAGAPGEAALAARAEGQIELRQATMAAAELARRGEQTEPVAEPIDQAVDAQAQAVHGLRGGDAAQARTGKRAAVERLEAALEMVRQQREEAAREEAAERRRELQAAYVELAERQEALREGVVDLAGGDEPMTRRQRNELVGRGGEQEEIRTAAAELAEEVAASLLFDYLHRRVDRAAGEAARGLRRGEAAEAAGPVTRAQAQVAADLRRMAAALDTDEQEAEFAGEPDGGGEGGGEAGAEPSVVPPLAELRLMRALQSAALEETRALHQRVGGEPDDAARARLGELSDEQRELAELGERLIEQMQRMMPGQVEEVERRREGR